MTDKRGIGGWLLVFILWLALTSSLNLLVGLRQTGYRRSEMGAFGILGVVTFESQSARLGICQEHYHLRFVVRLSNQVRASEEYIWFDVEGLIMRGSDRVAPTRQNTARMIHGIPLAALNRI
jgi:hypothetical protein